MGFANVKGNNRVQLGLAMVEEEKGIKRGKEGIRGKREGREVTQGHLVVASARH